MLSLFKPSRSLLFQILFGVAAVFCTIAVLVGWSIFFTNYYTLWKKIPRMPHLGVSYWLTLIIGCLFLLGIMIVLVLQLVGNIRYTLYLRRQDIFIDSVTHEFKSPLASIRLCLETMEMRDLTPEMKDRFVGMMKKDVERLIAFVEHILEAGRLEHKQREFKHAAVSIPETAERCAEMITDRYRLPSQAITVTSLVSPAHEVIISDAVACETILLNLIDNAVKYSEHPPEISVTLEEEGSWLKMSVRDKGIGIPKNLLKKVFQRFFRIRHDHTPHARGTGLGLYVVSSLVSGLGGTIHAMSQGEGFGSTFEVWLPKKTSAAEMQQTGTSAEQPTQA